MRHAAKVDANHSEIVSAFKAYGWAVKQTFRYPGLGCDLIVTRGDRLFLVEIKPAAKALLKPSERDLQQFAPFHFRRIETIEDVRAL